MGYEIININYELNPNLMVEEQHQQFASKQYQEGVYEGKEYAAKMDIEHKSKHDILR